MKYFWLTFSLFLFSLSVYPCRENDDCKKNVKTEATKKENHKNKNPNTENCTPFCTCSHCLASAFCLNVLNFELKNKTAFFQEKKLLGFYFFIYNKKIANTIWQPPKIS